jgi:hypothetical protein
VTIKLTVTGPTAAQITEFNPTTSTCKGTGAFTKCTVIGDKANVPLTVENDATVLTFKNLIITYTYGPNAVECPLVGSPAMTFPVTTVTPNQAGAPLVITSVAMVSTATSGAIASGSLVPESVKTFGLK